MDLSQLSSLTISGLIVLFMAAVGYLMKKLVDDNAATMRVMTEQIVHSQHRNDIQDQAIGQIMGETFNSEYLAVSKQAVPHFKKKPRDS